MFQIQLIRTIYDAPSRSRSKKLAILTLETSFPFAPHESLRLRLPGLPSGHIALVTWEHEQKKFRCELHPEYTPSQVWLDVDFNSRLKGLENDGWSLVLSEDVAEPDRA